MLDFLKKQFVDVIDWVESEDGILAYRFPMQDREIQMGAQLTVRDSQMAIFVNEGKIADIFKPGRYELSTKTLPILTTLQNWDKAFQSPFKSDVYFFSTREQINQRWGTQQPITIRDKEFGMIRMRAFGIFSYQLSDPSSFYLKISGTRDLYRVEELDGQLRAAVVTGIATALGNSDKAFLDMAANQTAFSELLKQELLSPFGNYGLALQSFYVESLNLPEELQAHLDKVISMKMVGNLDQYVKFQAAESLPIAAQNEGGVAGIGAGLAAGVSMGNTMMGAMGGGGATLNASEDPMALIENLHGLLTKGIITQEEFDQKKAELLKRIT